MILLSKQSSQLLLKSALTLSLLFVSSLPTFAAKNSLKSNSTQSTNINKNSNSVKIAGIVTRRDDFTFEYLGCQKYENQMHCTFKVIYVGNGEAKDFSITRARAFSAIDGNQYYSDYNQIGGSNYIDMIRNQATRGVLIFPWSPALSRLSTLEFETNQTSRKILIRYKPKPIPKPVVNPYVQ